MNPGLARLYTMDHWELFNRTNYFDYQKIRVNTPPTEGPDLANKSYVDTVVANALDNNWSTALTGNTNHLVYSYQGQQLIDVASVLPYIELKTNYLLTIYSPAYLYIEAYTTNLPAFYELQTSTNLAVLSSFTTFTNYTCTTNSGVASFEIEVIPTDDQRFFRLVGQASSTATFRVPVIASQGTIYPSNTWSLATVTNGLSNFSYWFGSSNGQALVSVYLSNGVAHIKRLAP